MSDIAWLATQFAGVFAKVAELERRFENSERHGTVEEVDAAKQRVRVRIGGEDGAPFLTPWIPYAQIAGDLKVHSPPSKGQQMTVHSPDGDLRQAVAHPFTWSDANKSPSSNADEHVSTFGQVKTTLKTAQHTREVAGATVDITPAKILSKLEGAVHEVLGSKIQSKIGSALLKVAVAQVKAAASRIDLN